jgi:hypothetical protein
MKVPPQPSRVAWAYLEGLGQNIRESKLSINETTSKHKNK